MRELTSAEKKVLKLHRKWRSGEEGGKQAVLSGAVLSWADLPGANLSRANLSGADLYVANLSRADLSGANLSRANLSGANLSGANLSGANLSGANLYGASLSGVKFSSSTRWPAPTMLLLASWGEVSDKLCLALMRFDCVNCPNGKARFAKWKRDGSCPFSGAGWQRAANFYERAELWRYGPALPALTLAKRLLAEKCVKVEA